MNSKADASLAALTEIDAASVSRPMEVLMACETHALLNELRQSVDAKAMDAIERLIQEAPDHKLCRINVLDFASKVGLDEERAIAGFLHATQMGLFELSWNVLCPALRRGSQHACHAEDRAP